MKNLMKSDMSNKNNELQFESQSNFEEIEGEENCIEIDAILQSKVIAVGGNKIEEEKVKKNEMLAQDKNMVEEEKVKNFMHKTYKNVRQVEMIKLQS